MYAPSFGKHCCKERPSQPDKTLTEHIRKAADTMNIHLIDHVVVCEDGFFSFADEGLL